MKSPRSRRDRTLICVLARPRPTPSYIPAKCLHLAAENHPAEQPFIPCLATVLVRRCRAAGMPSFIGGRRAWYGLDGELRATVSSESIHRRDRYLGRARIDHARRGRPMVIEQSTNTFSGRSTLLPPRRIVRALSAIARTAAQTSRRPSSTPFHAPDSSPLPPGLEPASRPTASRGSALQPRRCHRAMTRLSRSSRTSREPVFTACAGSTRRHPRVSLHDVTTRPHVHHDVGFFAVTCLMKRYRRPGSRRPVLLEEHRRRSPRASQECRGRLHSAAHRDTLAMKVATSAL